MTGEAGSGRSLPPLAQMVPYAAVATLLIAGGGALVAANLDRVNSLSLVLAGAAIIAGYMSIGPQDGPNVSAAFIVGLLAAAFLGPVSAGVAAILSELAATARRRSRARTVVLVNIPASVVPDVAAGALVVLLAPHPSDSATFYLVVAAAGVAILVL
ncbi:MAG TPA: hypothetical protein VIX82_16330, partial [Solirubrobacteraceae bacterium]